LKRQLLVPKDSVSPNSSRNLSLVGAPWCDKGKKELRDLSSLGTETDVSSVHPLVAAGAMDNSESRRQSTKQTTHYFKTTLFFRHKIERFAT
jgi:hypothetical protein